MNRKRSFIEGYKQATHFIIIIILRILVLNIIVSRSVKVFKMKTYFLYETDLSTTDFRNNYMINTIITTKSTNLCKIQNESQQIKILF